MLPLIELGGAAFDICMADTEVFDMPMELGLELMTIIGSDFSYPVWELVADVIDKVLSVSLGMLLIDLAQACSARQPVQAIAFEYPTDDSVGLFDAAIASQMPHDPFWPEIVFAPHLQHLLR